MLKSLSTLVLPLGAASLLAALPYVHRTTRSGWVAARGIHTVSSSNGKCNITDPSEVQYNYWQHIYPNFCKAHESTTRDEYDAEYTSANYIEHVDQGETFASLTPPPNSGMYQPINGNPFRYYFEFNPIKRDDEEPSANTTCHTSCSDAYYSLSEGMCGRTGAQMNHMAAEGFYDVGCGTYHYFIAFPDPDETHCHIDGSQWGVPVLPKQEWLIDDAEAAIESFCSVSPESNDMVVRVSPDHKPDGKTQGRDVGNAFPERQYNYMGTHTGIDIWAAFAGPLGLDNSTHCNNHTASDFWITPIADRCREILTKTIHRCNNEDERILTSGGWTMEHSAEHGCAVWQIYAYEIEVCDGIPGQDD